MLFQALPTTLEGAISLLGVALTSHAWLILGGAILMIAVVLLRQLDIASKVPDKYVPWVTVGLAVLGAVAVGLETGAALMSVLSSGLLAGLAAVGTWETAGKAVRDAASKPADVAPPSPPAPPVPPVPPAPANDSPAPPPG